MGLRIRGFLSSGRVQAWASRVWQRSSDLYNDMFIEQLPYFYALSLKTKLVAWCVHLVARVSYFFNEWVLTTNHRKIAVLYFGFVAVSGFTGLILATIIRLELAYPGQFFLTNNAERYLTVISLHGIVMVFFFVIPTLFGAFGNFLLPTQLGIRDVAFPRLNSFMFWVTPAGFVMLLHILMFDKSYSLTYWINYSETKAQLRRRYDEPRAEAARYHTASQSSVMAWRFQLMGPETAKTRNFVLKESAPALTETGLDAWTSIQSYFQEALELLTMGEHFVWLTRGQLLAAYAQGCDFFNTLFNVCLFVAPFHYHVRGHGAANAHIIAAVLGISAPRMGDYRIESGDLADIVMYVHVYQASFFSWCPAFCEIDRRNKAELLASWVHPQPKFFPYDMRAIAHDVASYLALAPYAPFNPNSQVFHSDRQLFHPDSPFFGLKTLALEFAPSIYYSLGVPYVASAPMHPQLQQWADSVQKTGLVPALAWTSLGHTDNPLARRLISPLAAASDSHTQEMSRELFELFEIVKHWALSSVFNSPVLMVPSEALFLFEEAVRRFGSKRFHKDALLGFIFPGSDVKLFSFPGEADLFEADDTLWERFLLWDMVYYAYLIELFDSVETYFSTIDQSAIVGWLWICLASVSDIVLWPWYDSFTLDVLWDFSELGRSVVAELPSALLQGGTVDSLTFATHADSGSISFYPQVKGSTHTATTVASPLRPAIATSFFNGDLFSAPWELRQLWAASLAFPQADASLSPAAKAPLSEAPVSPADAAKIIFSGAMDGEALAAFDAGMGYISATANINTNFGLTFDFLAGVEPHDRPFDQLTWRDRLILWETWLIAFPFTPQQHLFAEFVIPGHPHLGVCALEKVVDAVNGNTEAFNWILLVFLPGVEKRLYSWLCDHSGLIQAAVTTLVFGPAANVWSPEASLRALQVELAALYYDMFSAFFSLPSQPTLPWSTEAHTRLIADPSQWAVDSLFGVSWPSVAGARPAVPKLSTFTALSKLVKGSPQPKFPTVDFTLNAIAAWASAKAPLLAFAEDQQLRDMTIGYCLALWRADYLNDWRELKLEREIWRSIDSLAGARNHLMFRKKYYSNFYEPGSLINKVSTWLPNHLLPGWAFVTPYSSRLRYTALGKVDVALIVVFAASLGSIFSSVNYVITYRYIGAPTLKNRRELRSFFVDALLVASRMMILANPALMIGIILLLSDRHFNTSVFDFSGGGDTILFQHLFWFFGHPEVYIIIIPCFGIMNSLLPYYLKKRLSGRLSLQFSMYTIAYMSFAVWGHHMYMVGLANSVRTLYSTMTVMISVPASTKVIHWCVTLIESTLTLDVGFLFLLSFMYFFVLGGLSGMFVAHIGFDTIFHDTFYVIGHFHVMFAGAAVCCIFAAFYFYFPAIFGVRYSKFFAYLHYGFYMAGQLLTLIPMFWLGYAGMPRRIMDYPSSFGGWHSVISSGHILTVISFVFFLAMLMDSFYEGRAPISKTRGVSRLNTRLAFYLYESRKLQAYQTKALPLLRRSSATRAARGDLYKFCWRSEMTNFEYVFDHKVTKR